MVLDILSLPGARMEEKEVEVAASEAGLGQRQRREARWAAYFFRWKSTSLSNGSLVLSSSFNDWCMPFASLSAVTDMDGQKEDTASKMSVSNSG